MKDQIEQEIVNAWLKNYYLDDNQLNYLHVHQKPIFVLAPTEMCPCLEGKLVKDCCLSQKKPVEGAVESNRYISIMECMVNFELQKSYVSQESALLTCAQADVDGKPCCVKTCLNSRKSFSMQERYVADNFQDAKGNLLCFTEREAKHFIRNINNDFLSVVPKALACNYTMLCSDHYDQLIGKQKKLSAAVEAILLDWYDVQIQHQKWIGVFQKHYLQLDEMTQSIIVVRLRKLVKQLVCFQKQFELMINDLDNATQRFVLDEYTLPLTDNFAVNAVVYPQITPVTFDAVNAINNPFVPMRIAIISMHRLAKENKIVVCYDSAEQLLLNFWEQWKSKIKRAREKECLLSGLVLTSAQHFLISSAWYEQLTPMERRLFNVYCYSRFDQPRDTRSEMRIMNFYNNLQNGVSLFNKPGKFLKK